MKLDNEFEVPRSVDEAWAVLTDLERIAPCMPGAQLTEVEGDTYHGTVKVKVGPMVAQYAGQARFKEKDDATHRAVLEAKGKERTGKGLASALVTASLTGQGDNSTKVVVSTDLTISGPLAQFGRGAITEVSSKLLGQFSENLRSMLESGSSSAGDTPSSNGRGSAAAAASATGTPAPASPTASHVNGAPSIGTPADGQPVPSTSSSAATASTAASSGTATSGSAAPGASTPAVPPDSTTSTSAAAPSPTAASAAPSTATSGASSAPASPSTAMADAASSRRVVQSKEAEPVDLMSVAGSSILKRVIPLVIVLAIIIALIIWLVLS